MEIYQVKKIGISKDDIFGSPIIILYLYKDLFIPIWVGEFEGASIKIKLDKIKQTRPGPYECIIKLAKILQGTFDKVIINTLKENTYYSIFIIKDKQGKKYEIDMRPSDSIAIAVRTGTKIFVAKEILIALPEYNSESIQILESEEYEKNINNEPLNNKLNGIKPEDFK